MSIWKYVKDGLNPETMAHAAATHWQDTYAGPVRDASLITPELENKYFQIMQTLAQTPRFQHLVVQIVEGLGAENPGLPHWKILWVINNSLEMEIYPLLAAGAQLDDLTPEAAAAVSDLLLVKFFAEQNWLVRFFNDIQSKFDSLESAIQRRGEAALRAESPLSLD